MNSENDDEMKTVSQVKEPEKRQTQLSYDAVLFSELCITVKRVTAIARI